MGVRRAREGRGIVRVKIRASNQPPREERHAGAEVGRAARVVDRAGTVNVSDQVIPERWGQFMRDGLWRHRDARW